MSKYLTVAKNSALPSGSGLPENTKPINILANKAAANTDQNEWGKDWGVVRHPRSVVRCPSRVAHDTREKKNQSICVGFESSLGNLGGNGGEISTGDSTGCVLVTRLCSQRVCVSGQKSVNNVCILRSPVRRKAPKRSTAEIKHVLEG